MTTESQTALPYAGYYRLDDMTIEVKSISDGLGIVFPGVPPGFEVKLHPQDDHTFRMEGGPMDGVTAVFQTDNSGAITGVVVGSEYELARVDGPPQTDVPTGQGLAPPELILNEAKEAAFAGFVEEIMTQRDGRFIDYDLPYPKHEFLQYAAQQELFIFHGSAKPDIDEFVTRRTSMEFRDKSGRGNVQGIYGTHDGLWPLFFAVVDRGKISGSIRNGFNSFQNDDGEEIRVYRFSINKDWLDKDPWREGTLYLLPRDTFRQMPASVEGGLSNEWVSEVPVKPLARLAIKPEDFPFLDQVGGHDDSQLLRLQELGGKVTDVALEATKTPEQVSLKLAFDADLGAVLLEYIPLVQEFIPTARLVLRFEPEEGVWFDFAGPPAVMQVMGERVERNLKERAETRDEETAV